MLISKFGTDNIIEDIKDFEDKYKFKFPEQYKKFLIAYNGGETPDSEFRINKIHSDISGFFGLGKADENYNYSQFEKIGHFQGFLEDSVIPIGENTFGDYILLGIGEENNGKVFYRYHDKPKKDIVLTGDFIAFTKKCKSEKIGNIMSIEERKAMLIKNGKEKNITPDWIEAWQEEIDRYANIQQEKLILEG